MTHFYLLIGVVFICQFINQSNKNKFFHLLKDPKYSRIQIIKGCSTIMWNICMDFGIKSRQKKIRVVIGIVIKMLFPLFSYNNRFFVFSCHNQLFFTKKQILWEIYTRCEIKQDCWFSLLCKVNKEPEGAR